MGGSRLVFLLVWNSMSVLGVAVRRMGDGHVPTREPCSDKASNERCLCTSVKAGMRSPGLKSGGCGCCESFVHLTASETV